MQVLSFCSKTIINPRNQFTGSDNVGRILAGEAAKYLKPCVLELGGKAPCVVSCLSEPSTYGASNGRLGPRGCQFGGGS